MMKRLLLLAFGVIGLAAPVFAQNIVSDSLYVSGVRVSSVDGSPMSAADVTIRGVNSLRGDGAPLWIVDGAVLGNALNHNLDPFWQYADNGYASALDILPGISVYDIESVEVLKDASATALYGSRGANGVILIRTRKGDSRGTSIRWNSDLSVNEPTHQGYARTTFSHIHTLSAGGSNDRTSYMVSGNFTDCRYLLPGTGLRSGSLRTAFETKANQVVWFGFNSVLAAGNTSSAASTAPFGSTSQTIAMRDATLDPQTWTEDFDDDALDFRAVTSAWMTLNLFRGFSAGVDLGTDFRSNTRSFWYGNGTDFGLSKNGAAAILTSNTFNYNASLRLSYKRYFSQKHLLDVSAGAEALGEWNKLNNQNGTDFFLHDLRAKSLNVMASKAQIHHYTFDTFTVGAYASGSYSYDDMAGIRAAVRADNNPRFDGSDMVIYPSGELWWDISRSFFPSFRPVSKLALKGGYGESGLDLCLPFSLAGRMSARGWLVSVAPEHEAFHEVRNRLHTKEYNASVEAGFLSDRIVLEFGWFDRMTTDALTLYKGGMPGPDGLWEVAPISLLTEQESLISNNGIEWTLNAVPVLLRDWKWILNMTGTYYKNKIMSLAWADFDGFDVGGGLVGTRNYVARPVSEIVDSHGNPLGKTSPELYGSFGTFLSWKDLSLDALFDGAAGYSILNLNKMHINGDKEVTSAYVEKGDFLRLARLSLCYDVPLKKVDWIKSLKVRASARNVCTFTGYSGWTPDVNSYGISNSTAGMDYGSHQTARCWTLGLSLVF